MNTKGIREHATLASNVSANGEDGEAEAEAHAASKISWAQLEQILFIAILSTLLA
jgi:hypothetical protein